MIVADFRFTLSLKGFDIIRGKVTKKCEKRQIIYTCLKNFHKNDSFLMKYS